MTNSEIITKIKSEIRNRLMKKVKEADLYYGQSSKSDTIEGEMIAYTDMLSFVSGFKENDSWKPSKEQMEELWNVISYIEKPDSNFLGVPALLESLYEQLKKL